MCWSKYVCNPKQLSPMFKWMLLFAALLASTLACSQPSEMNHTPPSMENANPLSSLSSATFGGGCFWCTEAVFAELKGVTKVISGYSGGKIKNPTYKEICSGLTGHAEVIRVEYDPAQISYEELLEVFFLTHDPTTLNRQGNDVGTQYRSVVFYHDEQQKAAAERIRTEAQVHWKKPIVTEISQLTNFYEAENYHQDYYANNPFQPYCAFVISPKLEKFRKDFKNKLNTTPTN